MNKLIFLTTLFFCGAMVSLAQDNQAEMEKKWTAYMTPGDSHKLLSMDNGKWLEEATMYMMPNDPNPTKSKMTAESKMILGGRYQEMQHKGTIMGMPFEGVGTIGYDNASQRFVSSWIDNMGTGIMYMTGNYDAKTKSFNLRGECTDPMTGKTKVVREVYTITGDNTRRVEMFDTTPDGSEYKSMEITMTRTK